MAVRNLPKTFRKLVVSRLSTNFREAVETVSAKMLEPGPEEVLVKTRYAGINATDINHTAGRYKPWNKPPFDAGLEGLGEVVATGKDYKGKFSVGQPVMFMRFGGFAEYTLTEKDIVPVPRTNPIFLTLPISGMTAALSLEKLGELKKGETVLVTAAAGGTGQFAVQLAKQAGCHVIGTCSTEAKCDFLKSIGCDRPINYKTESLDKVLNKEYPKGIDVIYESIGGEIFDTCVNRLATKGRIIVIGFITAYKSQLGFNPSKTGTLLPKLLMKSGSLRTFMLFNYLSDMPTVFPRLISMLETGQLRISIDRGESSPRGPFCGLDSIYDAVEYLHDGKNRGKVVVEIAENTKS
ncbi:predicted protein, partial [Nematostella vectensis]